MNSQQAWQATMGQLQMEMAKALLIPGFAALSWFPTKKITFTVGVPNAYARDWLESRLSNTVNRLLTGIMASRRQWSSWSGTRV